MSNNSPWFLIPGVTFLVDHRNVQAKQIKYINNMNAAHTQPTNDPRNTNPCTVSAKPYLSNCNYDGAGAALQWLYGGEHQLAIISAFSDEFVVL